MPTLEQRAQGFYDAAMKHLLKAEDYARITVAAERLRQANPDMSEQQAIQKTLTRAYGDKAPEVARQIAQDADNMQAFKAGERLMAAKKSLDETGLEDISIIPPDKKAAATDAQKIKDTRNFFGHPDDLINRLKPGG